MAVLALLSLHSPALLVPRSDATLPIRVCVCVRRWCAQYPRAFEDPWPSKERMDLKLRSFLVEHRDTPPPEIKRLAKATFGIDLTN